jgi:hypothetical protein
MAATAKNAVGKVNPCRLIELEQHKDARGSLSVVEAHQVGGFPIQRVYFLHDVAPHASRGAHGHRSLEQIFIAVHGSFTITVDDGFQRGRYRLDDPGTGLYVGPMVWRDLSDFSPGAVSLVLASRPYDEADYFRDYDEFLCSARANATEATP